MECCSHAHLSTGTLKTGTWCRVCKQWNMYAYLPFHDFRCCEKFDHEVLHLVPAIKVFTGTNPQSDDTVSIT